MTLEQNDTLLCSRMEGEQNLCSGRYNTSGGSVIKGRGKAERRPFDKSPLSSSFTMAKVRFRSGLFLENDDMVRSLAL